MPEQQHDYVKFMAYNGELDEQEEVARVYLTDGELHWEGKQAEQVKKMADNDDRLQRYKEISNYSFLNELSRFMAGSYFYATDIIGAYDDVESEDDSISDETGDDTSP